MDIVKTIEVKEYKKIYINFLTLMCIMIAGTFFMLKTGVFVKRPPEESIQLRRILVIGLVLTSIIYSYYQKVQKDKLRAFIEFEDKKLFHLKYYKIRILWFVLSCLASCILFLVVANWFFFYFALFELLLMFITFPNRYFFKREMNEDDIVFV